MTAAIVSRPNSVNGTAQRDQSPPLPATRSTARPLSVGRGFVASCALLGVIGFFTSAYLGYIGLTASKVVGCDGGLFNCDHVLTSRWSTVMGIPVSLPAVALYAVVLAALANLRSSAAARRQIAASVLGVSATAAAGAAAWFVSLQVFTIGHFCPYCLVVHSCSVLLFGLLVWRRPIMSMRPAQVVSLGLLASAGLIAVQAVSPVPETFQIETHDAAEGPIEFDPLSDDPAPTRSGEAFDPTSALLANPVWSLLGLLAADDPAAGTQGISSDTESAEASRMVAILGGRLQLDARKWPVWGKPDAKYMVVEMFDYTCPHCRKTHLALRNASTRLGNDLSVLALPVPLHRDCNDAVTSSAPERADACELARLAIAVWLADPTKFTAYHDWLFQQKRTAAQARTEAERLVGRARLDKQLSDGMASKYIAKNVQLYKQAGGGTVPKILLPKTTLVGEIASGSTIADIVRKHLGR